MFHYYTPFTFAMMKIKKTKTKTKTKTKQQTNKQTNETKQTTTRNAVP